MSTVFRAGFAALVGRPNVGKSTLLNALVGEKLSIVTPRPQTTRHRIVGLVNRPEAQIAFVDTPGLHKGGKRALNHAMNRTAASAMADADVVVFVVEALRYTEEDAAVLSRFEKWERPVIAVVNKMDKVKPREKALPWVAELATRYAFAEIVPCSAKDNSNLEALLRVIGAQLPESPPLFPPEQLTDRDTAFRVAEEIREKLTLELEEEVPYGIAVAIERLAEEEGRLVVHAVIWVDREGQKPIVIGAGGERLKRVGRSARLSLNHSLGRRVHLELWVKVREDWADNALALKSLGLE